MERSNFLSNIMRKDLDEGKHTQIVTRFPPEPNGYLHIGHAKSICINFGLGEQFGGVTFMRFDDTNPDKEEQEYVDAIMRDVKWLGFDWKVAERQTYASDYFDKFYEYAIMLIKDGKAYVESLSPEEMREYRGSLTQPGRDSPHRTRSIEENLELFEEMAAGEVEDGAACVRLKIDMNSPNMNLRDPAIYRIKRNAEHPQTGTKWKIYPMYDYAHVLTDAMEGITHSLCTLEFEDHRPLYDWVLDNLPVPARPRQIEFSRLNLQYCVVSKRKLIKLVTDGHVAGWDDPRMPTICGLRRRGVPPEALRLFVERTGVSKADNNIDYSVLEECAREVLDPATPRAMAVLDPIKITVTSWPVGEVDVLEGPMHPKLPELGMRKIEFGRNILIERDDFMEDPPPKKWCLKPGGMVRLRYGYVLVCDEVVKDADGKVTELKCSHLPETRQGGKLDSGEKVKGIIHWLSEDHCERVNVNLYDRLFTAPNPGAGHEDGDFLKDVNPDSLQQLTQVAVEPWVADAEPMTRLQFERMGYFCVDEASTAGAVSMNRIVTLKDTWNAEPEPPKAKAPKAKQEQSPKKAKAPADAMPFEMLDVRVGKIVEAWEHPDSDKLWCERIDVGEEEPREIASGLRAYYKTAEELVDRKVLVVCNLKPAKLGGFASNGMVLCASNGDRSTVAFVEPPEAAALGERVLMEGAEPVEPAGANKVNKKKLLEKAAEELCAIDSVAHAHGKPLVAGGERCVSPTIEEGSIS